MQAKELTAKLSAENEVLEALRQIRQVIDINKQMLTQLLPTIPTILGIAKNTKNEQIRFEAVLTILWFTKTEKESEKQILVDAGCIPIFCDSISAKASEDMLCICSSALHNLAYNSITRRDQIISLGVLSKLAEVLTTAVQQHMEEVFESVSMAIRTLMSMKPTPEVQYAKEVIPALHKLLCNKIFDAQLYAFQTIDQIASGSKEHLEAATGPLHIRSVLVYYLANEHVLEPALSIIVKASFIKSLATSFVTGGLLRHIISSRSSKICTPFIVLRNLASFCDDKHLLTKVLNAQDCIKYLDITIQRGLTTKDPKKEEAREYAIEALLYLVKFSKTTTAATL